MSETRNATPAGTLEQRIMDPCALKSEAEHWAAREIEKQRAEIERLRAALEGIRIDGPDADGLVWATIQHPAIAVRSHVMVGNVNRMVSQAFMDFEEMRRKALEDKL